MRPVIILFAKAPIPGRVKTRLQPPLTAAQAAALHNAFVRDSIERLQSDQHWALELHTDIETCVWDEMDVPKRLQCEGDLGLKMLQALAAALERGHERAMIVGTDAPSVPLTSLHHLLSVDADVSLGPATDGGYYAIAARRTHPEMFVGVEWGSRTALSQTVSSCLRAGLSVMIGEPWFDVDEPADLRRLFSDTALPSHTAEWLRRQGGSSAPFLADAANPNV